MQLSKNQIDQNQEKIMKRSVVIMSPESPVFFQPLDNVFSPKMHYKKHTAIPTEFPTDIKPFTAKENTDFETVLKRKRPPMLDLTTTPLVTSWSCKTPEKKGEEVIELEKDRFYSVYCKKGKRGPMEDRYFEFVDSNKAFFGVFDGHGGSEAAEFAANHLWRNIESEMKGGGEGIERVIRDGYVKTDEEFLKEGLRGGACCVTALILKEGEIVVSNVGDCRGVMSNGGVAEALTCDHNPSQVNELKRIQALGGYVDCCNGVWRIQGTLAVSRGIGDRYLKKWVIAEPETRTLQIKPEFEFLILASDGLWDKVSNQEAIDVVRPYCVGVENPKTLSACKKLAELSCKRGCLDDISLIIIQLQQFVA